MVRVHFGPPLLRSVKNGVKTWTRESERRECQNGLESRLLATVRWTVATGVAFPQESESILAHHLFETRGFSSAGRAPALQAGGQRFDPANLHQKRDWLKSQGQKCDWGFIESLERDSKLHLENWTLWIMMQLWEGNSKGKCLTEALKIQSWVKIQFLLNKIQNMSLHNSTIKRTEWTFLDSWPERRSS